MTAITFKSVWVNYSFRLVIDGDTVATVPRTTSREIDRYKAHATHPGKAVTPCPK